jgi:hypothetical protein
MRCASNAAPGGAAAVALLARGAVEVQHDVHVVGQQQRLDAVGQAGRGGQHRAPPHGAPGEGAGHDDRGLPQRLSSLA